MTNESPEPPSLDETLVQKLAELASKIDGCPESTTVELVREFNRLAETEIPYDEFQGIYGAEDHINYVRRVLVAKQAKPDSTLGRQQLVEMFKRISNDPTDDAYLEFAFSTIEQTFGDSQVSDLVFWPGHYFGDGDNSRELTPEQMADTVLERFNQRNAQ